MTAALSRRASPARRERNADETKRRLLDAAEGEFASKGFDGARLGNIAVSAGVQQALIHHYFDDKEGLYREVVLRGLAAVTAEGWDILARLAESAAFTELLDAFVDMLMRFYATHRALIAIVRHEGEGDGGGTAQVRELLQKNTRPIFDAVVARIEAMRAKGEVRKDVDARHLCVSAVALVAFPFQEERFLAAIWPADWRDPALLEERRREIVATITARALPAVRSGRAPRSPARPRARRRRAP